MTKAIIEYTRELAAHQGHPVDDWTDEEVLQLAASWGFVPVLAVLIDVPQPTTVH